MTYDPNQPPRSPFGAPEPGQPGAGQQNPQAGYPTQQTGYPTQQPVMQPVQPVAPSYIPPSVAAAVAKPKSGGRITAGTVVFTAALIVAAVGVGFAAGRVTAPTTPNRTAFNGQFGGGNGQFGGPNASGNPGNGIGRGGFGGAFLGGGGANISIDGKVTAVSNGSITIQTANGQNVTLQVPSTATYHAQAPANSSDVIVGSNVQVSVSRPTGAPEASGQPAPSGSPTTGGGNGNGRNFGGFGMSVTDITVLSK